MVLTKHIVIHYNTILNNSIEGNNIIITNE